MSCYSVMFSRPMCRFPNFSKAVCSIALLIVVGFSPNGLIIFTRRVNLDLGGAFLGAHVPLRLPTNCS